MKNNLNSMKSEVKLRRFNLIWSFLLLCCSCTTSNQSIIQTAERLETNPPPTPEFILSTGTNEYYPLGECVEIDQTKIWEAGDYPEPLIQHLRTNTVLEVDHQIVPFDLSFSLAVDYIVDESNNVLGSTGGPMLLCIDPRNYINGLHLATIRFTSTSGINYSFSWAFSVQTEMPTQDASSP